MGEASRLGGLAARVRRTAAFDVVGVGECSLDEVWRVEAPLERGSKQRAAGREVLGGGQVATAMVACARLGLRAAFAGAVGDDEAGRAVLEGLRDERVDVTATRVMPGGATRAALVIVDGAGERTVVERTDRRVAQGAETLPRALLESTSVVHLDGVHPAASLAAARIARAAGAIVSLDLDHAFPGIDDLLALGDLCFLSEKLPHDLTGEKDLPAALRALESRTAGVVGCTLGAQGAAVLDGDRLLLSPAFPADDVVDTTACGDTFRAAAIAALLDARPIRDLLRFANAAAALKCRALGRLGCPTKPEVLALLSRA
jgi:sugar/nucleoside kinase (ribokinase family)